MKEMFWPTLNEFPESQEIKDARMDVCNCIRALIVTIEMMKFFDDVFLNIPSVCRTILDRMEVEDMWIGMIGGFEDV